jgi:O-antigen/teichoic acid export membrane protein
MGSLLIMTGHEKLMRNIVLISACLDILLNIILDPIYGINGAAFATAFCLAWQSICAAYLVFKILKFRTV